MTFDPLRTTPGTDGVGLCPTAHDSGDLIGAGLGRGLDLRLLNLTAASASLSLGDVCASLSFVSCVLLAGYARFLISLGGRLPAIGDRGSSTATDDGEPAHSQRRELIPCP